MRLEDDVILLRPFARADVPAIVAACQDPEIPRWTSVPFPYTEADARAWLKSDEEETFAVIDGTSGELLGSIGMRFPTDETGEVGYWVKREARGRGVATRALVLIARWGFQDTSSGAAAAQGGAGERRFPACCRESRVPSGGGPAWRTRDQG